MALNEVIAHIIDKVSGKTLAINADRSINVKNAITRDFLFNYKLSDIDDGEPVYLGYLDKDGAWYIQKIVNGSTITYVKGDSGYDFSNRTSETYGSFDSVF